MWNKCSGQFCSLLSIFNNIFMIVCHTFISFIFNLSHVFIYPYIQFLYQSYLALVRYTLLQSMKENWKNIWVLLDGQKTTGKSVTSCRPMMIWKHFEWFSYMPLLRPSFHPPYVSLSFLLSFQYLLRNKNSFRELGWLLVTFSTDDSKLFWSLELRTLTKSWVKTSNSSYSEFSIVQQGTVYSNSFRPKL